MRWAACHAPPPSRTLMLLPLYLPSSASISALVAGLASVHSLLGLSVVLRRFGLLLSQQDRRPAFLGSICRGPGPRGIEEEAVLGVVREQWAGHPECGPRHCQPAAAEPSGSRAHRECTGTPWHSRPGRTSRPGRVGPSPISLHRVLSARRERSSSRRP